MLLLALISMVVSLPLFSVSITTPLMIRITVLSFIMASALTLNMVDQMDSVFMFCGLFQSSSYTLFADFLLTLIAALVLAGTVSQKIEHNNSDQGNHGNHGNHGDHSDHSLGGIPEYAFMALFSTAGASFLVASSDLVSLFLSLELQSFAVYLIATIGHPYTRVNSGTNENTVNSGQNNSGQSAGLKYFLLGALSSAMILLGSSLLYSLTGTTQLEGIAMILENTNINNDYAGTTSSTFVLPTLLIAAGLLFKIAGAPFHSWAPSVYDGVPTVVTTWLTIMPKISILVLLIYLAQCLPLTDLLLLSSALSLIIGTVVGLAQTRIKRLLAYSTISHVGWLLLAIAVNTEDSLSGFAFYLTQYSLTNLAAFLVLLLLPLNLNQMEDLGLIKELKGMWKIQPVAATTLILCLFSMAGIPPLVGFFGKFMILYASIGQGYYWVSLIGILASVISAAYYMRVIRIMAFEASDVNVNVNANTNANANANANTEILPFNSQESHSKKIRTQAYLIAVLVILMVGLFLAPTLLVNCSNLLALAFFTY